MRNIDLPLPQADSDHSVYPLDRDSRLFNPLAYAYIWHFLPGEEGSSTMPEESCWLSPESEAIDIGAMQEGDQVIHSDHSFGGELEPIDVHSFRDQDAGIIYSCQRKALLELVSGHNPEPAGEALETKLARYCFDYFLSWLEANISSLLDGGVDGLEGRISASQLPPSDLIDLLELLVEVTEEEEQSIVRHLLAAQLAAAGLDSQAAQVLSDDVKDDNTPEDHKDLAERKIEEGFGGMGPWLVLAGDKSEAEQWRSHFLSPEEAEPWIALGGLQPEAAGRWSAAGFTPREAKGWIEAELDYSISEAMAWSGCGFRPEEADAWHPNRNGISAGELFYPPSAQQFREAGFTAEQAAEFYAAGVGAEEASVWRDAGFLAEESCEGQLREIAAWKEFFSAEQAALWLHILPGQPEEASHWAKAGFDPQAAEVWAQAGLRPSPALLWSEAGFSPQQAGEWFAVEIDHEGSVLRWTPFEARILIEAGMSPEESALWAAEGFTNLEDIQPCMRWRSLGFSAAETRIWSRIFSLPEEADGWRQGGFTPGEAEEWSEQHFTVVEAEAWRSCRFDLDPAYRWRSRDFDALEASLWRDMGFYPDSANKLRQQGLEPEEIEEILPHWGESGFEPDAIPRWIGDFELEEALEWRKVCKFADEAYEWKAAGLTPAHVAEWRQSGLHPQDVVGWCKLGIGAEEAIMWRARGFADVIAANWRGHGFVPEQAAWWAEAKFSAEDASVWRSYVADADRANELRERGFTPERAGEVEDANPLIRGVLTHFGSRE